jgi:hypothetical protein
MTVWYLNVTINRNTQKRELEIGPDRSSQPWQHLPVDAYGYGLGPPRSCGLGFWTVLEPNRTIYPVQSRTAGGLPRSFANTSQLWHIRRNGFIGYALASGVQCNGRSCEKLTSGSFYLCTKWNSLFTKFRHHSKLPDLCGNWQSIARCVHLLSYY